MAGIAGTAGFGIRVTPAVLHNQAVEVSNQINALYNELQAMNTVVNSTKQYWQGDAAETERAQYEKLSETVNNMITYIKSYSDQLVRMGTGYDSVEAENVNLASALEGDIIS